MHVLQQEQVCEGFQSTKQLMQGQNAKAEHMQRTDNMKHEGVFCTGDVKMPGNVLLTHHS